MCSQEGGTGLLLLVMAVGSGTSERLAVPVSSRENLLWSLSVLLLSSAFIPGLMPWNPLNPGCCVCLLPTSG